MFFCNCKIDRNWYLKCAENKTDEFEKLILKLYVMFVLYFFKLPSDSKTSKTIYILQNDKVIC